MGSTIALLIIGLIIFLLVTNNKKEKQETKGEDIGKYFPIRKIEDGIMYSEDGYITFSYKQELPWVFTLNRDMLNEISDGWRNSIKTVGLEGVIHRQDIVTIGKEELKVGMDMSYTQKKNIKNALFRPVPEMVSYLHISIPLESKYKQNSTKKVFSIPIDLDYEKVKEIEKKIESIENSFKSIQKTKTIRLKSEEQRDILERYCNLNFTKDIQKILDPVQSEKDFTKIGGKYIKVFNIREEGDYLSTFQIPSRINANLFNTNVQLSEDPGNNASMMYPLTLGLPIDHVTNVIIKIKDNEVVDRKLSVEKIKLNPLVVARNKSARDKAEEIDIFLNHLSKYNHQACQTAVNVIVYDTNKEELQRKVSVIEENFKKLNNSKTWEENLETHQEFHNSIPGNAQNYKKYWYNAVDQAVCYIQKEGFITGMDEGVQFTDDFGKRFRFNLFKNPFTDVKHACIFGMTRSGKSVTMNHVVDDVLYQNGHVIIIDKDHSYRRNNKMRNGKYIDTAQMKVNIFTLCDKDINGQYLYLQDFHLDFVTEVIIRIWSGNSSIKPHMKQIIKDSISEFYEERFSKALVPTLAGYYEYLNIFEKNLQEDHKGFINFKEIKLALKDYAIGEYSQIFNTEENDDFITNPFIVFDAKSVSGSKELFNIICLIIIKIAMYKANKYPKNIMKFFLIDEAVDFLEGDIGEFIGGAYRMIAKQGGAMAIATQDSTFLDRADPMVKNSIIKNTGILMVLGSGGKTEVITQLRDKFNLNSSQCEMIQNMNRDEENRKKYRKIFIKIEDFSFTPRLEVSQESLGVYTSDPDEVPIIEGIIEENKGNIEISIDEYVEKLNKK